MNPAPVDEPHHFPRVTALIVTHNSAQQLRACLTALEQSEQRERLEIVVIDNGSRDGSAEIPNDFPEVQSMRLPKEFGFTKAANIGMRTAKGDFIFFVPPHVEVEPDTITRLAGRLESSEAIGAVCPAIDRWFPFPGAQALAAACQTGVLPGGQAPPEDAESVAADYVPSAPIMVRKLFLRGMNYFDERFGDAWADLELCWQLRNSGKAILILPHVKVRYGVPPAIQQDTAHVADRATGAAAYLGKHFGSGAGIKFRLSAALQALTRAQLPRVSALLSGQKIDGTHV